MLMKQISALPNIEIIYSAQIDTIEKKDGEYVVCLDGGKLYSGGFVLNATYASVNQILSKIPEFELFSIKYELCEIILCNVNDELKKIGLTVMDGPFFLSCLLGKQGCIR